MIETTTMEQDVAVVSLKGSLDVSVQKELKEELLEIADRKQNDIALDLSNVEFIDSSCLGVLVSLAKRFREKKGDIKLFGLTDDVRSIFQITRLDKVFEVFDGKSEAVDSFYR